MSQEVVELVGSDGGGTPNLWNPVYKSSSFMIHAGVRSNYVVFSFH